MSDWPSAIERVPTGVLDVVNDFQAQPDDYYIDGVATSASTTFTSATANFTSTDVGKVIHILRGGPSALQDLPTTIASVTNATTVVLANAAGRSQSNCRFYISRAGDQTSKFQAALDFGSGLFGGVRVNVPTGGFLVGGLVMKGRNSMDGQGLAATLLHATHGLNAPVIRNDQTSQNSANYCEITRMTIDGARFRQSNVTTTLGAAYAAGDATVTLASTANVLNEGVLQVGTNRIRYQAIGSATTVTSAQGGTEDTTDAAGASGATVTQNKNHGIFFAPVPATSMGTDEESFDPHWLIRDVRVKSCKGDGVSIWGQSEGRIDNVWATYNDEYGIRPSFDTWVSNSTGDNNGRAGYHVWGSECHGTNNKAFFNGGVTAAAGFGFFFEGPASLEEGTKSWVACDAQDNKADGYYSRTAQRIFLQGSASSNGTSSAGTYCGLKIDGSSNGEYHVHCTERAAVATQLNALNLLGTALSPTNNEIVITHGFSVGAGSTSGVQGPAIKSGSVGVNSNVIRINGQPMNTAGTVYKSSDTTQTAVGFADVAGLTQAVSAGTYRIKVFLLYQSSVITTAALPGLNGPTLTSMTVKVAKQIGVGGTASEALMAEGILTAYNANIAGGTPNPATDEPAAGVNLVCEMEGVITVSAAGTIAVRMSKDVAAGTITMKAGSFMELERLDVTAI